MLCLSEKVYFFGVRFYGAILNIFRKLEYQNRLMGEITKLMIIATMIIMIMTPRQGESNCSNNKLLKEKNKKKDSRTVLTIDGLKTVTSTVWWVAHKLRLQFYIDFVRFLNNKDLI